MPNIKLKYAVVLLDYKGNSERMIKKKKGNSERDSHLVRFGK